ncbi:IgGFc-binding protein-like [Ascaphus truei]|uniref:IgGFc-binding protein-like n=1 Tax=Ascaphus truei TaxID=8439 RepID=UPI003F5AD04B
MVPSSLFHLLICIILLCGTNLASHLGQEFLTVFPQNANFSSQGSQFNLTISAFNAQTSVTVSLPGPQIIGTLLLNNQVSKTISLPKDIALIGSGIFNSSVLITSDKDISVVAWNSKGSSSYRTIVYPVNQLGTEYYIVSPNDEPRDNLKALAVVNYNLPTTVKIFIKKWVIFRGKNYTSDHTLKVDLQPLQVLQLKSKQDLSGVRVLSEKPVAVLSGDSCLWKNSRWDYIYAQLLPVSSWGKKYLVAPLPFLYRSDIAYVVASQKTLVNYTLGATQHSQLMNAGHVLKIFVRFYWPLVISANASVQVMFYCTGGIIEGIPLHPFLANVPDTSKFCTTYQVHGLHNVINAVLITAKTSSIGGILFDRKSLDRIQWRKIPGTEYSWAQYRYGRQFQSHTLHNSESPFGVISVGLSAQTSYGLSGVCVKRKNSCSYHQCRKKESCQLLKDEPICMPDSEVICRVWGDPHYHTFDGHNYDFQGTCTYIVAKTCRGPSGVGGDPTLPEFCIEAKNENRGSVHVSYIAVVTVQVHGYNITMVRSEVGLVRVNNIRWTLPISLDGGRIRIMPSGFHALLETDFIRIQYDWNIFLFIQIPSSFYENVCGLCGNYNGEQADDFQTPVGIQVPGSVEFGKSWKVENVDDTCWDDCHGTCESVQSGVSSIYQGPASCGILSLKHGPFNVCHLAIDHTPFLKSCIYDMVKNGGYKRILCQSITVYLVACQMYGIHVENWRNIVDCAIMCPENSRYNSCGSACPTTCAGKPSQCLRPCVETCECDPGFVLSEGKCIPKTSCGCFFRGRHYPSNEVFWRGTGCEQKCMCLPGVRKVECWKISCREGEECTVKEGIKNCYPVKYSTCSASGDPHYITFDGVRYDFQGTCQYQLSGLCDQNRGLTEFQVHVLNQNRGRRSVSYTGAVCIRVHGIEIQVSRGSPGRALLNGVLINLPYCFGLDRVKVFQQGWNVVIITNFGLKVTFDWQSWVTVRVPHSYSGAVCGLCGNFNGRPDDELMMRNGQVTTSISAFGRSWRTNEAPMECKEVEPRPCPLLKTMDKSQSRSRNDCGILLQKNGPFQECHKLVDPEGFFQNCLYDSCFYSGRQDVFCQVIAAYAGACQEAGGTVCSWRKENFCKPWCPENSYYKLCSVGCAATCSSLSSPLSCSNICKEGCVCNDGYILNVDLCVRIPHCGCIHHGFYYKINETFYPTPNCEQQCVCKPGGSVHCTPFACGPYEDCNILDGVRKCHPTGSARCSAAGGLHYSTFDGLTYDFQGNCSYILAKICTRGKTPLTEFIVTVENKKCAGSSVAVTKVVTVNVNDVQISLLQGIYGMVQINHTLSNLPLLLWNRGVWVYQHGINVILRADFGLQVTYDLAYQAVVTIPSSYRRQTRGLCGNYNGNQKDEFQLPDGSLARDVIAFGEAWQTNSSGKVCSIGCGGPENICPHCVKKSLYQGKNYCGLLLTPEGPFTSCRNRVDPTVYFNNCVFDLCHGRGNISFLCHNIQSYVSACQNAGITELRWRSNTFCPLNCFPNSHYEVCIDTCSNTCARISSPITCPIECSEGCQCDEGYYLEAQRCVTLDKCGCFINDRYYKINETFLQNKCQQQCTCHPACIVTCETYSCKTQTECQGQLDGTLMCKGIVKDSPHDSAYHDEESNS